MNRVLQSLRRLETSTLKNIRCSTSSSSSSSSKPPEDKRKWTWKQIKDIQRYKRDTELFLGSVSKKPSKSKEYSAGNEVYAAVGDADVLSRLTDEELKLLQAEEQLLFNRSVDGSENREKESFEEERDEKELKDQLFESRSSEKIEVEVSQPVDSGVTNSKTDLKSISRSRDSDLNSKSERTGQNDKISLNVESEEEEEFVDYFDDPSEVPSAPKPSQVQPRKKMNFTPTSKTPLPPSNSFPRDFPTPKSPMDNILVFPMLPSDKTIPDIPADLLPNGKLPSVTRILGKTQTPESIATLAMWEKKMIEELGLEGFQQLKEETFKRGHQLHACIEQRLHGTEDCNLDITHLIEGHWKSMSSVFTHIGEVNFTEARVEHPVLKYAGIFDCIAYYKDTLCLIDWKTSKRQKSRLQYTYDNPVQLAAYIGALNYDPEYMDPVHRAVLVIAYENGSPAHVYQLSPHQLSAYWRKWAKRLHQYYTQISPSE